MAMGTLVAEQAEPEPEPESEAQPGGLVRLWEQVRGRPVAVLVIAIGVAIPLWRMARIVGASGHLQYADYWPMLQTFIDEDGGLNWGGLFESRNGHPIAVAKLLYIVNIWLSDGSNIWQGAIVIVISLAMITVVGLLARSTDGLGRWGRVLLVVATAFAVFAPTGMWSYVKAMSGTAWFTANLFFLVALLFQQRDRQALCVLSLVAATISYGTALLAWPAVVVAGLLRHGRRWQQQWPVWVASVLALVWFQVSRTDHASPPTSDPVMAVRNAIALLMNPVGPDLPVRGVVLFALLGLAGAVALWVGRDHLTAVAPWVALVVYGSLSALLVGRSRIIEAAVSTDPAPSRYWSTTMWFWVGVIGVALLAMRGRRWQVPLGVLASVLLLWKGTFTDYNLDGAVRNNDVLAVALMFDLAEGNRIAGGSTGFPAVTDRMRQIGHYPFDGTFDPDCGRAGSTVTVESRLPAGFRGEADNRPRPNSETIDHFVGWVDSPDGELECVLVLDEAGTVVGAGATRPISDVASRVAIRTVAPVGATVTIAVQFEPDGPFYPVSFSP